MTKKISWCVRITGSTGEFRKRNAIPVGTNLVLSRTVPTRGKALELCKGIRDEIAHFGRNSWISQEALVIIAKTFISVDVEMEKIVTHDVGDDNHDAEDEDKDFIKETFYFPNGPHQLGIKNQISYFMYEEDSQRLLENIDYIEKKLISENEINTPLLDRIDAIGKELYKTFEKKEDI